MEAVEPPGTPEDSEALAPMNFASPVDDTCDGAWAASEPLDFGAQSSVMPEHVEATAVPQRALAAMHHRRTAAAPVRPAPVCRPSTERPVPKHSPDEDLIHRGATASNSQGSSVVDFDTGLSVTTLAPAIGSSCAVDGSGYTPAYSLPSSSYR